MSSHTLNLTSSQDSSSKSAAELDRRYRQRLCRLVERELDRSFRSREDPEDVVQTVFRTYFRRAAAGQFRVTDSTDLWCLLAAITRHKILKRAEFHRAEKRNPQAEANPAGEWQGTAEPGPVDAAIAAELIDKMLSGLEPFAAQVFQLRIAGCTEKEIGEQLGCVRAKVRLSLRRIRDRLTTLAASDPVPSPKGRS
jgi:RNA polymerase sigma-70 factor (ECF subfamily)